MGLDKPFLANFIQGTCPPFERSPQRLSLLLLDPPFLSQPLSRGQTIRTAKHPNGGLDQKKLSACHQMKSGAREGKLYKEKSNGYFVVELRHETKVHQVLRGPFFIRSFVFVDSPTWRTILGEPFITDISSPSPPFCPRASTSPQNVMGRGAGRGKERDGDGGGANQRSTILVDGRRGCPLSNHG